MARVADPEKMDSIKKAVMECIIECGYAGVSIASICEKAGVSPGYLYRYYQSKDELVSELVDTEMRAIITNFIADIDSSDTLFETACKIVKRLFMKANDEPLTAKFTASVVMDLKIPAEEKNDNFKQVLELAGRCIRLGSRTGETTPAITPVELAVVSFTVPFRYLLVSLELDPSKKFTVEEAERIARMCINAVG
jgi:AcrR family transcriptional regulator